MIGDLFIRSPTISTLSLKYERAVWMTLLIQVFLCNVNSNDVCPENCEYCSSPGLCVKCKTNRFGAQCQRICQGCSVDGCDITTGRCLQCQHGYYSDTCSVKCPGYCNPSSTGNTHCDRNTGVCLEGCSEGRWSGHCNRSCPVNCEKRACLVSNGQCLGCKPGWRDLWCNETTSAYATGETVEGLQCTIWCLSSVGCSIFLLLVNILAFLCSCTRRRLQNNVARGILGGVQFLLAVASTVCTVVYCLSNFPTVLHYVVIAGCGVSVVTTMAYCLFCTCCASKGNTRRKKKKGKKKGVEESSPEEYIPLKEDTPTRSREEDNQCDDTIQTSTEKKKESVPSEKRPSIPESPASPAPPLTTSQNVQQIKSAQNTTNTGETGSQFRNFAVGMDPHGAIWGAP